MFIAKSSPRDCKITFNIGRGCAELQILKKWSEKSGRTELTIVMKFCIYIDIDKMYPKRLSNVIWDSRGSNSEKQWHWLCLLKPFEYFDKIVHTHYYWRELDKGILSSVQAMPRSQSWKQGKLTRSSFGTFWYAAVQILKKSKTDMDI